MSSNLIVFPAARRAPANGEARWVQLSLQMSDGSEVCGEVSLEAGQSLHDLLQDGRGFIPVMRSSGEFYVISSDLVDGIRLADGDDDGFPAA